MVSRSEASARQAAEELGIPLAGTDLDRIADIKEPDGIVICAANEAHYDSATQAFDVTGNVSYRAPGLELSGESGMWNGDGSGRFVRGNFELPTRPARGRRVQEVVEGEDILVWHLPRRLPPGTAAPWPPA